MRLLNSPISHSLTIVVQPSYCFALMFWGFAYGILSVRASLLSDHDLELWSTKRALATSVGAILYAAILVKAVERWGTNGQRFGSVLTAAAAVVASVLATRLLFDYFAGNGILAITTDLRWLVVWTGYFAAWVGAYVAYKNRQQIKQLERLRPDTRSASPRTARSEQWLWVRCKGATVCMHPDDIERFEAEGNYVRVHACNGRTGFARLTLHRLVTDLAPEEFIRVHRSYICRRRSIEGLKRNSNGGFRLVLASGAEVPVGRSFSHLVLSEYAPR